jgi:hypothetical protein
MGKHRAATRPAVRRATQQLRTAARNRWLRLASLVDQGIIRRPNYVHEQDLTDTQRADIAAALQDWLRHPLSGYVEPDPACEINVAYHAGFLLAASWLLFSGTEAPELGAVFARHRIDLHPDWWLTDGWADYHDRYGVRCAGENGCGSYTYAVPNGHYLVPDPLHMDWPDRCGGCRAPLPVQHHTDVSGADGRFWADCCCGWATDTPMAQRHAKAMATRHVTVARNAQLIAG